MEKYNITLHLGQVEVELGFLSKFTQQTQAGRANVWLPDLLVFIIDYELAA